MSTISMTEMESSKEKSKLFPKSLSNLKFALFLLCIAVVIQSMMVTGALNVSISRIEKAFRYNSFQVAFIDTTYNISFSIFALLLGYFITKHKMRWIGFGTFLIGVGCIIFILPVFINKNINEQGFDKNMLCDEIATIAPNDCQKDSIIYLFILCFGYFFIGIGASNFHTLVINYISEHTSSENVGLFNGIYYASAAFGPVISFFLYAVFVKFPVKLFVDQNITILPGSENWIGAYWIIYAIGAILAFLLSIPMMLFPTQIPGYQYIGTPSFKTQTGTFASKMRNIFSNRPFMFVSIGMFFDGIMNNGIGVFLAKYIESQFRVSTGKAAVFSGSLIVTGASSGLFIGGLCIKYFKWTQKQIINRICIISFIGIIAACFLFIRCPTVEIQGVQYSSTKELEFKLKCSKTCKCDITQYMPVCIENSFTYYSPCTLGCTVKLNESDPYRFENCKCYDGYKTTMIVEQGSCKSSCMMIYVFIPLGLIFLIIEFLTYTPEISFSLLVLDLDCKQFGISCQQIFLRLSYICGPLIMGPLLDHACILFNTTSSCEKSTNCINYNLTYLSISVGVFSVTCKSISTFFLYFSAKYTKEYPNT